MTISDEALDFLREQYELSLENWFDDPDEGFTSWTHAEFIDWYEKMVRIGKEVNKEFWSIQATDYEIDRAKTMLKVAGHPEFAEYQPQE